MTAKATERGQTAAASAGRSGRGTLDGPRIRQIRDRLYVFIPNYIINYCLNNLLRIINEAINLVRKGTNQVHSCFLICNARQEM